MPFQILILAVIDYRARPKKLKQETNAIFWGVLTIQVASRKSSETRISITFWKQVIFQYQFARPLQILARTDPKMIKVLKRFYNNECWLF